jgi:hypothetical protein
MSDNIKFIHLYFFVNFGPVFSTKVAETDLHNLGLDFWENLSLLWIDYRTNMLFVYYLLSNLHLENTELRDRDANRLVVVCRTRRLHSGFPDRWILRSLIRVLDDQFSCAIVDKDGHLPGVGRFLYAFTFAIVKVGADRHAIIVFDLGLLVIAVENKRTHPRALPVIDQIAFFVIAKRIPTGLFLVLALYMCDESPFPKT